MNKKKLRELIKNLVKEYMGTGSSGGNAGDGNNITSPRPFADDIDELKNYIEKNIYGGEGGHYNKDQYNANYPNRQKMTKFETISKRRGKFYGQHDYYGNNTGGRNSISGLPGVWEQNLKENNMDEQDKDQYGRTQADRDWEQGINPKSSTPSKTVNYTEKQKVLINGVNTEVTIEDKSSGNCPSELNQSCLDNVTISWGDKKFEGLEFEIEDTFDSHDNEGDDTTFIAKEEQDGIEYIFAVEVSVEYNYSNSGNIQAVSWKYLEIDEKQDPRMDPAIRSDFDDPVMELFINEQDADAKAYETGLKRLQKGVIQFQLRYIQKQKSKAAAQAASATQEAGKGFEQQIKALQDQLKAIDQPPKKQQKESLYKKYIRERANDNLMVHMDVYKQTVLLENTMKSLFKMFGKGKTNEEVLRHYAEKGITMPEQFLTKTRKQYEGLKKQKLEIEFSEQEAKDILFKPTIPQAQLFDMGDQEIEEKQLASGILKNNKK